MLAYHVAVEGTDPIRRDKLIELLDIDLQWRMHKVSDGQRRRVQICMGLLHPFKVLGLLRGLSFASVLHRLNSVNSTMSAGVGSENRSLYCHHSDPWRILKRLVLVNKNDHKVNEFLENMTPSCNHTQWVYLVQPCIVMSRIN